MKKNYFDELYLKFNSSDRIVSDPIQFVYQYKDMESAEVAGFIAAVFAYGRVENIIKNIESILFQFGGNPYNFIVNNNTSFIEIFEGFKYRFNNSGDLALLLETLRITLRHHSSLRLLFKKLWKNTGGDIKKTEIEFIGILKKNADIALRKNTLKTSAFQYLLSSPERGGAAKRLNLFIKWMGRKDFVDPGLWAEEIPDLKRNLIIPLDTHISLCARNFEMTSRKTNDWKTALEITEYLKKLDPEDPIKYDFALCHNGMENIRK